MSITDEERAALIERMDQALERAAILRSETVNLWASDVRLIKLDFTDKKPFQLSDDMLTDLSMRLNGEGSALSREAAHALSQLRAQAAWRPDRTLHVVFDGPPGPEAGRFVECETPDGRSICAGTWHERPDGFWELRIAAWRPDREEIARAICDSTLWPGAWERANDVERDNWLHNADAVRALPPPPQNPRKDPEP